jgi:hypothetical protein
MMPRIATSLLMGLLSGVQLDDSSIYMVCMANGRHRPEHMRSQKIFAIRFRVKPDCSGIELLPAPGSPADPGLAR